MSKPVIFLAFANDKVDDTQYLRNLPKEMAGIREALQPAVKAGLVEVVERANATITQILDIFQDPGYKDRVAIFHYGGHANGFQLLLESLDGTVSEMHSAGFVPFLARQKGLQLVFLNGCSSQQQAQDMIKAGVPAVVGTSQSIDDQIATSLSTRFYKGLAGGSAIYKSWQDSIDEVKMMKGESNTRGLHFKGKKEVSDRFPWEMYLKDGSELVKDWNLPDEANNPLFGLPPIPKTYNLPESPFLFFARYERRHAEVFFGRSYYTRDLFNKVTDVKSPPVILLYGKSGVGKSSLFDAGLNPRLEESHHVLYLRRDQNLGLLKTVMAGLKKELPEQDKTENLEEDVSESPETQSAGEIHDDKTVAQLKALAENADEETREEIKALLNKIERKKVAVQRAGQLFRDKGDKISLREYWDLVSDLHQKPIVVILDQVEELFTRPNPSQHNELGIFLEALSELYYSPQNYPDGKLILGFRKEYHPEILKAFKQYQIPRSGLFLEHLNKKDIIEIFSGLATTPDLVKQYNLQVEEGLPEMIANDLLEDRNSSVAPILQILLTKMWAKAKELDPSNPVFSIDLYQNLKREGILLDDFFEQQMEKLEEWDEAFVNSGMALSILNFHTTDLATAGVRTMDEILTRYAHQEDLVKDGLEKMKELYLLNDAGTNASGLTHDTLAPLVQRAYKDSDRPGQRAGRLLSNKLHEFLNDNENVLDKNDLEIVEAGKAGMRNWDENERKLIEASQIKRDKELANKRRIRIAGVVSLVVIIGFAIGATILSFIASEAKAKAERAAWESHVSDSLAQIEKNKAVLATKQAKAQKAAADTARLAAEASDSVAKIERDNAIVSEQKAISASKVAFLAKLEADSSAKVALLQKNLATENAIKAEKQKRKAEALRLMAMGRNMTLKGSQMKPRGQKALFTLAGFNVYMKNIDPRAIEKARELYPPLHKTNQGIYGKGYNAISYAGVDSMNFHVDQVRGLTLDPSHDHRFASGGGMGNIYIWEAKGRDMVSSFVTDVKNGIRTLEFSPDGRYLAFNWSYAKVGLVDTYAPKNAIKGLNRHSNEVWALEFGLQRNTLFSGGADSTIIQWDYLSGEVLTAQRLASRIVSIAQTKNPEEVAVVLHNGLALIWNWKDSTTVLIDHFKSSPKNLRATAVECDLVSGKLGLGTESGAVYVYNIQTKRILKTIADHLGPVTSLAFSENGNELYSVSLDGTIKWWSLGKKNIPPVTIDQENGWVWNVICNQKKNFLITSDSKGGVWYFPLKIENLTKDWCKVIPRNFSLKEWHLAAGIDVPYDTTCKSLPVPNHSDLLQREEDL